MSARQLLHARRSLALARHALVGTKSVRTTPSVYAHIEEAVCSQHGSLPPKYTRGFAAQGKAVQTRGPVSYISLALTLGTGAGLLWYYSHVRDNKLSDIRAKQESVGVAAIGGPFELVDQHNRPFTDKDLHGKHSLLYFGFTNCPDICPDELVKLAGAIDNVGGEHEDGPSCDGKDAVAEKRTGKQVQPVFISIDPERDSVEKVREYVKGFHPRLIGLTGTTEKVKEAARAYRVYYTKTNDDPEDYLVDHSIIMYLLDPQAHFMAFYGKNLDTAELSDKISKAIV